MKKFAVLLVLLPLYAHGTAPFGLEWGDDVSQYGEPKRQGPGSWVNTDSLPKSLSIASHYQLYADEHNGLLEVTAVSNRYGLYDDDLNEDFDFSRQSLIDAGYHTVEFVSSKINSYQCVLQGYCAGQRWNGVIDDGTNVILEQVAKTREDAYIKLIFKSPKQVEIEAQREAELTSEVQDKRVSDRSAFD